MMADSDSDGDEFALPEPSMMARKKPRATSRSVDSSLLNIDSFLQQSSDFLEKAEQKRQLDLHEQTKEEQNQQIEDIGNLASENRENGNAYTRMLEQCGLEIDPAQRLERDRRVALANLIQTETSYDEKSPSRQPDWIRFTNEPANLPATAPATLEEALRDCHPQLRAKLLGDTSASTSTTLPPATMALLLPHILSRTLVPLVDKYYHHHPDATIPSSAFLHWLLRCAICIEDAAISTTSTTCRTSQSATTALLTLLQRTPTRIRQQYQTCLAPLIRAYWECWTVHTTTTMNEFPQGHTKNVEGFWNLVQLTTPMVPFIWKEKNDSVLTPETLLVQLALALLDPDVQPPHKSGIHSCWMAVWKYHTLHNDNNNNNNDIPTATNFQHCCRSLAHNVFRQIETQGNHDDDDGSWWLLYSKLIQNLPWQESSSSQQACIMWWNGRAIMATVALSYLYSDIEDLETKVSSMVASEKSKAVASVFDQNYSSVAQCILYLRHIWGIQEIAQEGPRHLAAILCIFEVIVLNLTIMMDCDPSVRSEPEDAHCLWKLLHALGEDLIRISQLTGRERFDDHLRRIDHLVGLLNSILEGAKVRLSKWGGFSPDVNELKQSSLDNYFSRSVSADESP